MFTKRRFVVVAALAGVLLSPAVTPGSFAVTGQQQEQEGPGRGDDLERIRRWRSFLERAERAFFAAHMDGAAVATKITQAEERIEELEAVEKSGEPDPGGRSDITGDVGFLERAHRAFTAAHMSTAEVQRWLREAREKK